MRGTASFCLLLLPFAAVAQSAIPTDFPADATVLAADALQQRMAGKVFRARLSEWNRSPSSCSEARATNDALYIKRVVSGEVVALRPD